MDLAGPPRSNQRPMRRLLVAAALLALLLAVAECLLHLFPALLPAGYLHAFPGNGTEFLHPAVFERTEVEGVLLPHLSTAHDGPPPADLKELGLAPLDADEDVRTFPHVVVPADADGLPDVPDGGGAADLVLVGDSFGVSAAVRDPEGLELRLERATGLSALNVSLAGVGPAQERWLVERVGLVRARPRAVLWLYFSGNDLTASHEPFLARRAGHTTWAEAFPERRKPFLYLPDLVARSLRSRPGPPCPAPLPGFPLPRADGSSRPVWFHPDYLRQLGWSLEEWRAYPAWPYVQAELRGARDACAAAGAKLLLVYLPSKPEVCLPSVPRDPALALRTITALGQPPPPGEPEAIYDALLANRRAHEELLHEFCAQESIPFLSALPALEDQAARGELGYLATDTHWTSVGQAALLEPLLAFLREQGIVE